jgi:hypothetical protein
MTKTQQRLHSIKLNALANLARLVTSDRWRSSQFLLLGVILEVLAYDRDLDLVHRWPGLQDDIHSFAILCLRGSLGYWLARICLTRLPHDIFKTGNLREAILAGFSILARALLVGLALVSFK